MTSLSTTPLESDPDPEDESFTTSAVLNHADGAAHVHLIGELCPTSAPVLRSMLGGLVDDGIARIVVDLSELRLCTSHGVDVLDEARIRLADRGGSLRIENAHGVVRTVFEITGLGDEVEA